MHSTRFKSSLFPLIAVLLAGFALRVGLMLFHGLEGDDGFSLALSRLPLETLIPGLMRLELDIHPPLHFLALKGWTALAGDSLLALRTMNVLADVLAGACIARLAYESTHHRNAALVGALLWAVSPLLIYSGWLLRMYSLAGLFACAGALCTVALARGRSPFWAAGLFVCALAGLYTHIVGVIAWGAFGLGLIASRRPRTLLTGGTALGLAGLLFLPFALPVLDVYRSGRTLGASVNTTGIAAPVDAPGVIASALLTHRPILPALLLLALMILATLYALTRWKTQLLPLVAVAWGGIGGMIALAVAADLYKPRYLAPFVGPLLALLAGAVIALPRRAFVLAAVAGLMLLSGLGIRADLDRTLRDDWVAAADFIQAHQRPGDVIVVIPDWGQEAFNFHYRGGLPVTGLFPQLSEAVDYAPILAGVVGDASGAWLVRYQPEVSDPTGLALRWFAERGPAAIQVYPAGMQVLYYDLTAAQSTLPPEARPLDATFGDVARLHGVFLPVTRAHATDSRLHPPSGWVHVTLYWESLQTNAAFTPRVRFTGPVGELYGGALDLENDVLSRHPVASWQPGERWTLHSTLNLNPATPPGVYNIEVMVLGPDGQPLPASGPDAGASWVIAGQVMVD